MSATAVTHRHPRIPGDEVTAFVLAGGKGERVRSVLGDTPKVLAPIGRAPFIVQLLRFLVGQGIDRFIVCTGYAAAEVEQVVEWSNVSQRVTFSRESEPLGTGGALRRALHKTQCKAILAINADTMCALAIDRLLAFHRSNQADWSVVVAEVPDCSRFGRVEFAADGRITAFGEKPPAHTPGWVSAGILVINRELLEPLRENQPFSLERDVLPGWLPKRGFAFTPGEEFYDFGTPEALAGAETFFRKWSAHFGEEP